MSKKKTKDDFSFTHCLIPVMSNHHYYRCIVQPVVSSSTQQNFGLYRHKMAQHTKQNHHANKKNSSSSLNYHFQHSHQHLIVQLHILIDSDQQKQTNITNKPYTDVKCIDNRSFNKYFNTQLENQKNFCFIFQFYFYLQSFPYYLFNLS